MDWKNLTLKSALKLNKDKLIFLFCSGLLLFILALPRSSDNVVTSTDAKVIEAGGNANSTAEIQEAAADKGIPAGTSYEVNLEQRIRTILSSVEGVGAVDVMIVLKSTEEKVLRVDKTTSLSTTEEKGSSETTRTTHQQDQSETTVTEGPDSTPFVEKELSPELSGIIISAEGGGSAVVRAEIAEAMEALFGLPSHKIKVLKRQGSHEKKQS